MRLNASIATLVLAGLSLLPTTLLAKQARPVAHKAAAAATRKHVHKKTTDEAPAKAHKKRRRSHLRQEEVQEPVTVNRVHLNSRKRRGASRIAANTESPEPESLTRSAESVAPRKATSEDFVRAAAGLSIDGSNTASRGVYHPPDDDEESPRSAPTSRSLATSNAAITPTKLASEPTSREILADDIAAPVIQPTLYNRRGRLIVPPPLKGSHEILVHQNIVADREGLDRIKDDDDLDDMRAHRLLVSLPLSGALEVDDRLPANRRYCRPWTAQFLAALARAHYARFHTPLQVNSAVRTVEFQQRLLRTNGNAAPAEGETASPHLTGQAIDLAKHGLSLTEIAWLRGYLLPLVQQGKIDVEEEFQQSCFHISVYKRYLPATGTPKREIASGSHTGTSALAAAIP